MLFQMLNTLFED